MLFVHQILPPEGMSWLQSNQDVFKQFVMLLSGQDDVDEIATIIKHADQRSTSKALGAQHVPTFSTEKPLFLKIKSSLRSLIAQGDVSLNRKGANGWIAYDHVWILAKIAVDKIREQLEREGHGGVPSDNSRVFDIMMDHGLIQANPDGEKAIWKINVETLEWKPTNDFSVIKIPLNIAYATETDERFDGILTVIENHEKSTISEIEYIEPLDNSLNTEQDEVSASQLDPHDDKQVTEVTSTKDESKIEPENSLKQYTPAALYNGTDPTIIRENLGTDFYFWIKESLTNQSISKNTATSFIHNNKVGLLLVSPKIFKEYCEQNSLNDWPAVQKSFQSLRLNLKTPGKGENTFQVRVSGKRKISMLQCWIIPHNEFDGIPLPKYNQHLEVLNFNEDP